MTPSIIERRRSRNTRGLTHDDVTALKSWLARHIDVPVRVDRLDGDDQRALRDLVRRASTETGGRNLRQLDKRELARFEALVERAGGLEAGELKRRRQEEETARKIVALGRRAARPAQPRGGEEIALLTLMHQHVRDGFLTLDGVAVLVFVLGQILAAEAISPGARIEGTGDTLVLVLDANVGLGQDFDPDAAITRWKPALDHAALNGWLRLDKRGRHWSVSLGPRTVEVLR
jgi:hypothetical protein